MSALATGVARDAGGPDDQVVEIARGLLLLGVFHVHALYALQDHLRGGEIAGASWLQVKVLAPHVVLFFALSGMTSTALFEKRKTIVLSRSVMLLMLAAFSHIIGEVLQRVTWKPWGSLRDAASDMLLPLVLGTGHSNYVAWFFVVLAVVRLMAYWLVTNRLLFSVAALGAVGLAFIGQLRPALDNAYEWRNWPAALLMFIVGAQLLPGWRSPNWLGLPSVFAGLTLTAFNRPSLLQDGPCLWCEPDFVAQPMVGSFGVLPVFLLQEFLTLAGLLWLAHLAARTVVGTGLAWVGARSIHLLVLHGWVVVTVYAVVGYVAPYITSPWMFVLVAVGNTLLHVALYHVTARPLSRFISFCSNASRRLVAAIHPFVRRRRQFRAA